MAENNGREKKKVEWEMEIVFWVFIVMCIATIVDIVPAIDGSTWATRLYGIVCLAGVIFCAKNKGQFMFIDAFVLMYPKAMQRVLAVICDILALLVLIVLEVTVIISLMNVMQTGVSGIEGYYNLVLYILSVIVYPITFVYTLIGMFSKKEAKEA